MHLKITAQKIKDFYDKQQTAKQKENFKDKLLSNFLRAKWPLKNMVWSHVVTNSKKSGKVNGKKKTSKTNYCQIT